MQVANFPTYTLQNRLQSAIRGVITKVLESNPIVRHDLLLARRNLAEVVLQPLPHLAAWIGMVVDSLASKVAYRKKKTFRKV